MKKTRIDVGARQTRTRADCRRDRAQRRGSLEPARPHRYGPVPGIDPVAAGRPAGRRRWPRGSPSSPARTRSSRSGHGSGDLGRGRRQLAGVVGPDFAAVEFGAGEQLGQVGRAARSATRWGSRTTTARTGVNPAPNPESADGDGCGRGCPAGPATDSKQVGPPHRAVDHDRLGRIDRAGERRALEQAHLQPDASLGALLAGRRVGIDKVQVAGDDADSFEAPGVKHVIQARQPAKPAGSRSRPAGVVTPGRANPGHQRRRHRLRRPPRARPGHDGARRRDRGGTRRRVLGRQRRSGCACTGSSLKCTGPRSREFPRRGRSADRLPCA